MNKPLLITLVLVFLIVISGVGIYLYFFRSSAKSKDSTVVPGFQNPFIGSPSSSFGSTSPTPSFVNPIATPTPTVYQNPFDTTSTQPYQNPFEKLR